jgi:multiple sugar transport system ATP-binding protein
MAQFPARVNGGAARIDGLSWTLPLPAAEGQKVLVGLWPDDIELAAAPALDFHEGRVYATDFRGRDQAIEVRFGDHRFRKVVGLELTLHQGDACWFRLPPAKALYFDAQSGARLAGKGNGGGA